VLNSSRGLRRGLGVALVALLVLSGCTPPRHQSPVVETAAPIVPDDVAPEVAEFYSQTPEWSECREELQCADVRVPVDWDEPTAGEITIRVARNLASGTKIGSLFVNPGGPGGSGVDLVEQIGTLFGERLLESYDIVGFDPRGVGESAPVQCLDDAGKDALYSRDFDYSTVEASLDLGANETRTFLRIVVPAVLPGVIAGALVAFTLSFDEFVIAFFTAGTTVTFPIQIYSMIRFGVTPEINAIATFVVVVSITLVLLSQRLRGREAALT